MTRFLWIKNKQGGVSPKNLLSIGVQSRTDSIQRTIYHFYVDNLISAAETSNELSTKHQLIRDPEHQMLQYSMKLFQKIWIVLGTVWRLGIGTLKLSFYEDIKVNKWATKQSILSRLAQNYETSGFLVLAN
ncbi:unnamed protein product [Enterobius vermicularis]|uniref:ABC transmembrane type-1 domain-containing protein n=1 Tax=Enterobius vermicularis TaxID=51028 RepID=A0A0N4V5K8_ENTVE|nr:unnamed protein product [Enterobius vermicularis]